MNHDQNFKNLIIEYPYEALAFFAGAEGAALPKTVRILPIRQEQLKERLGERFRELDIPLLVEWPDGQREAIVFVLEEETDPKRFSIHRLAHYCLDLSDMLETDRVVPVVIFLHAGNFRRDLDLHGQQASYLRFSFITCDLSTMPAEQYFTSTNIVARLNLLNMRYNPTRRVEVYARAQEGLAELESDPEKRLKYADFIEAYANLTKDEWECFINEYLPKSERREVIMGLVQRCREEGRQQGFREGLLASIELGLELKFGDEGLRLLPEIRNIEDIAVLGTIREALKAVDSPEALRRLYADR